MSVARFRVVVDDGPFDLALSAFGGQMFRWERISPTTILGLDGAHWYRIETGEGGEALPWGGARATGMNTDARRDALRAAADEDESFHPTTLDVVSNATKSDFRRLLRLDQSENEVRGAMMARGPEIAPYLAATRGLRLLRPAGRVESLVSFILSANNNVPRISGMARLLGRYGEAMEEGYRAFPSLERLARLDESELRAQSFGYRAHSVIATARTIEERGGEAYLNALAERPFEELIVELQELRGVGPKVAECIALFAFDRTEAVPIDTHVWQALARLYPDAAPGAFTHRKGREAAEALRARFGPYAARAQSALFYDNLLNWRSRQADARRAST